MNKLEKIIGFKRTKHNPLSCLKDSEKWNVVYKDYEKPIYHTDLYKLVEDKLIFIKGQPFVLVTTSASYTGKILCRTTAEGMLQVVPDIRPDKYIAGWSLDKKGDAILINSKGDIIDIFTKEYCRLRNIDWDDILTKIEEYPLITLS